jgi:hypothetical protein
VLPPGGEGKIEVKVATRGRQGKLEKTVVVYSNDPDKPQFELKIRANVEVLLSLDPDKLALRPLLKGTRAEHTIRLAGKLADQAKIVAVESSRPELKAELAKDADGKQVVHLVYQAPDKPERFSANLTLKTDQESAKELKFFFSAEVTGDLTLSVPFLMFSSFEEGKATEASLSVRSLGGKPFKIKKVEDSNGVITAQVTAQGVEQQIKLTLGKPPAAPRGTLKVLTDREDQPVLEVQYNVRPKGVPPGLRPPMVRGGVPTPGSPDGLKPAQGLQLQPPNKLQRSPLRLTPAKSPEAPPPKAP